MKLSIFLSHPKPINDAQEKFILRLKEFLTMRGFQPRTLGITDYDVDAPLTAIRRLMLESNGLLTVALKRTFIEKGTIQRRVHLVRETEAEGALTSNPEKSVARRLDGVWLTSPWPHIEAAMAYQLGLPILILREHGVFEDGILERGVVGIYMPECDVDNPDEYLQSSMWTDMFARWDGYVRQVADKKGQPPRLFG